MKGFFGLIGLFLCCATAWAGDPERIELPLARFATGDDAAWREPGFDDSAWKAVDTTRNYEAQGFVGYDGFSWYRIHVRLPTGLKASSDWAERLRLDLSTIDDVDETYFNGVLVGKTGRMPHEPGGYGSRWQTERRYLVDARLVRWDADNVIAIRVYDGVGGGGFYKAMPFVAMAQRLDGLRLTSAGHRFLPGARVASTLQVTNAYPVAQGGMLESVVTDRASGRVLSRRHRALKVAPLGQAAVPLTLPARPGIEVAHRYVDARSGRFVAATHVAPYVLTPHDPATPRIHGATVVGVRPGSPLMFKIAATGRAPLRYAASGLPAGLSVDAASGLITGTLAAPGRHVAALQVHNALGSDNRELAIVVGEQLALTPPMGWNSWNAHGLGVSDERVRQAAQALVDKGLAAHGWNHVNIDDGWQAEMRGSDGELAGNARFPDMPALGRFVHGLGLKFGIYSSPGARTCGQYLGSLGHEAQDAASYASWGVDFLKYDLCSYSERMSAQPTVAEHQAPYRLMGQALQSQRRDIVFSLCQYGKREVWTWGATVGGHAWRTTDDIEDTWASVRAIGFAQAPHAAFAGPGRWNDPDMLVVGTVSWGEAPRASRLTPDEQYSHISLWSLLAAPLLLGNDLQNLDTFTLGLLTNHEVNAINQDPLGRSAQRVLDRDDWQVWVKELAGGAKAVGFFNLGPGYRKLELQAAALGIPGRFRMRDAWRQRDLGASAGPIAVQAPAHGVVLLVLEPR
jgi:hypothetical protein